MKSPPASAPEQGFKLRPSPTLLLIEVLLHLLVAVCIVVLTSPPWMYLLLVLLVLTGYRYFDRQSGVRHIGKHCRLDIDPESGSLTWHTGDIGHTYPIDQVKIKLTAWFILLQLGHGCSHKQYLLLPDSFENRQLYSLCRKHLKRPEYAG